MTWRAPAAAVAFALLLVSCSSGDDDTAPTSTTSTTRTGTAEAFAGIHLTKIATAEQPTAMTWCPDGTTYVAERTGRVRRLEHDAVSSRAVVDVSGALSLFGEQGLLGIACAPDGRSMIVSYTNHDGDTRVVTYALSDTGASAPRVLFAIHQPGSNHNGGNVVFGPDGKLWFGLGDGGGSSDRYANPQNPRTPLGKIVRLDLAGGDPDIVVSGVRNPWRFSFDRQTHDLWIGDVGEHAVEEIDRLNAGKIDGANLGWPKFEGSTPFRDVSVPDDAVGPVFEYHHDEGSAVVGGYRYRGTAIPGFQGTYLFADAYTARIRGIVDGADKWTERGDLGVVVPGGLVSSFAEDPTGELFVLSLGGGIYRIDPAEAAGADHIDLEARPPAPGSPEAAAAMLADAEAVIHDQRRASQGSDALANAAHLEQVAVRTIADHPDWDERVLAGVPEKYRQAVTDNVTASRELRALVANPRPNLPAWRIVEPAPGDELRRYYEEGEAEYGVPWQYLAAVHLVETKTGRVRGASTAGALGPMQFLPETWAKYGRGDIESNHDSILTAARYLAANGAPGDMHAALLRYNPTERYVRAITLYAERMRADPLAYRAYWGWQVYYWSTLGDVWLRVGWSLDAPRPVEAGDLQ